MAGPVTVSAAGTGWPAELGTPARGAGLGGAAALALIGTSVAAFAVVMALGPSATVPRIGTGAPLFWWPAHPSAALVSALERLGVLAGALGTAIGLAAIRRGWRPSAWLLPGAGVLAAGLFVVLPPAGSTDVLSYACYGRIASLGHSPYLVTPAQLYRASDPVGILGPAAWRTLPSVYGPVATVVQWAAAELGGGSMARIVFWIRLGNALAFLATAVALLRLVGQDPVRRIRVCLLWTANPLMLFWLIGSGHLDVLIALLTVAALLAIRRPGTTGGLVGGILAGAADNPHRFLNVMAKGTYIAPHRHLDPRKAESFLVLRGEVAFFIFMTRAKWRAPKWWAAILWESTLHPAFGIPYHLCRPTRSVMR